MVFGFGFHIDILLFQKHLLKWLSILHCIIFVPLVKIIWPNSCGSKSGPSICLFVCSIARFVCPFTKCRTVLTIITFKKYKSILVFFFKSILAIVCSLYFYINFIIGLSVSALVCIGIAMKSNCNSFYRLLWAELTFKQFLVLLSMNM